MANKHAFILAGGRSRRFGSDKTALMWDKESLVTHMVHQLQSVGWEPVILGEPRPHFMDARIIPDETPFDGALPAIVRAFHLLKCERALVVAADMPFPSFELLHVMWCESHRYNVVHPDVSCLPTMVDAEAIHVMHAMVVRGCRRIQDLDSAVPRLRQIPQSEWKYYDPFGSSFININTPQDWDTAYTNIDKNFSV